MIDYTAIFSEIDKGLEEQYNLGKVATYIPELGNVDADKFGLCLSMIDGKDFAYGDFNEKFSIQSIVKVLALTMAYNIENEKLWKRVGVEPSGTPFNSLVLLEHNKGIPRNPLINAGALVVCDILISRLEHPKKELLDFIHMVSGFDNINFNPKVVASEKSMGFRNAALINLMKSLGNINNDIEEVLDFYFNLCSIEMTCKELSYTFLYLANDGFSPVTQKRIVSVSKSKRINAIMQLCGFYDEAGEFSFKVGLPGKSGVGGGIVAVYPNRYSIAVWSPKLNSKGNSWKGMKFLEQFTTKTKLSIF